MTSTVLTDWASIFKQAIIAGIAGAVLFDVYLWPTSVMPSHGTMFAMWQWVASAVVGPVALTSLTYAWLGMLVHLVVSIGWAGGYAYLTRSQPFLNQRWLISGLFYGFMVYVFMQLVMLGAHVFVFPDNADIVLNSVIAHCVFFGLPVAYVVARMNPKT